MSERKKTLKQHLKEGLSLKAFAKDFAYATICVVGVMIGYYLSMVI